MIEQPPFNPNQFATDLEYWKESSKWYKQRAEAAEARIKASQEQEPSVVIAGVSKLAIEIVDANGNDIEWAVLGVGAKFYSSPIIPPDVAKLQRENKELTRKLAEQQAYLDAHEAPEFLSEFGREELTKLLAEAKRQGANEAIGNYMPDFSGVTPHPGGSNE